MTHKTPIRRGVVTDTTNQMLEEAEGEVLERGVNPKVVQERGGWASTTFFLSVYAHVMPGAQEQAAQAVSDMLKKLK